jgi:hypothetical protein
MTSDSQRQADRQLGEILTAEAGRIMLTPSAEAPLPGEMEALDAAEAEFAQRKTHASTTCCASDLSNHDRRRERPAWPGQIGPYAIVASYAPGGAFDHVYV